MIARYLQAVLSFLFLITIGCDVAPVKEPIEVSCSTATGQWIMSSVKCNDVEQSDLPKQVFKFNPGKTLEKLKGSLACQTTTLWNIEEAISPHFHLSRENRVSCSNNGRIVTSCSDDSIECTAGTSSESIFNRYSSCAIIDDTMTLRKTVSPSNTSNNESLCSSGQQEVVTFIPGTLGTPPTAPTIPTVPIVPDHLFFSQQPTNTNSYTSIAPSITVEIRDASSNLVNTATGFVTLTLSTDPSAGVATLGGTRTVTAIGGQAVFSNINLNFAAEGYTLSATSGSLRAATSASFDIRPTGSVSVSSISQNTTEAGGQGTFSVVLNSAPLTDVTIPISSDDPGEGLVDKTSLTFTSANWSTPQVVTVTGQSDDIIDGNIVYTVRTGIASSSDTNYNGYDPDDVTIVNLDSASSPGITVSAVSNNISEDGTQATFSIVLNQAPTSDVSIDLSSSDLGEATIDLSTLTFTPINWATPQVVTITGVNDAISDGDQRISIVTEPVVSTDTNYLGLNPANVSLLNLDDDTIGIMVSAVTGNTTETGTAATFDVRLSSQPTNDVVINVLSSDTSEGTVSTSSLTFTTLNWSSFQTVTITGADDVLQDGNQPYTIFLQPATSTDANYNGFDPSDVFLSNIDDDSVGINVSEVSGNTSELGTQQTFTVVLTSPPSADVSINLSSSDTGEVTVSTGSLLFTTGNWSTPQIVTLTGVNDGVADGHQPVEIDLARATSTDANYNGIVPANVNLLNIDDDTPGFLIQSSSGHVTSESGAESSLTIALTSQPSADVTLTLTNGDASEISLSNSSFVFTTSNWMVPREVTMTGVDDAVQDGTQSVTISTNPATSTDPNYNLKDPEDIFVNNWDNDTPGVLVNPSSGNSQRIILSESGSQQIVDVVLTSKPTANVTINLSSNDTSEGTISKSSLVFTAENWNSPQYFTVIAADDALQDGAREWKVILDDVVSSDTAYSGLSVVDLFFTTLDDDSPGVAHSPDTSSNTVYVHESGTTKEFEIVLSSQPTGQVTVNARSDDTSETNVSPTSFVFTTDNWNVPQKGFVSGVDDGAFDRERTGDILFSAVSPDGDYNGIGIDDFRVVCVDDEFPGFFSTPDTENGAGAAVTTESGQQAFVDIGLRTEPNADVTLTFDSDDLTEGVPHITSLTFTPENWTAPQRVWITGVDDDTADGDRSYRLRMNNATSSDFWYSGAKPADFTLINLDND